MLILEIERNVKIRMLIYIRNKNVDSTNGWRQYFQTRKFLLEFCLLISKKI